MRNVGSILRRGSKVVVTVAGKYINTTITGRVWKSDRMVLYTTRATGGELLNFGSTSSGPFTKHHLGRGEVSPFPKWTVIEKGKRFYVTYQ